MENKVENLSENSIQNIYEENTNTSPTFPNTSIENNDSCKEISTTENTSCNTNNEINENNTSNCLALTIKEDYKLTSKTNRILRSLRMSFKVFVSYVTLNIIKLFF